MDDLGDQVDGMDPLSLEATKTHLDNIIASMPVNSPEDMTMKWVELNSRVNDLLEHSKDVETIQAANAKAETDILRWKTTVR